MGLKRPYREQHQEGPTPTEHREHVKMNTNMDVALKTYNIAYTVWGAREELEALVEAGMDSYEAADRIRQDRGFTVEDVLELDQQQRQEFRNMLDEAPTLVLTNTVSIPNMTMEEFTLWGDVQDAGLETEVATYVHQGYSLNSAVALVGMHDDLDFDVEDTPDEDF